MSVVLAEVEGRPSWVEFSIRRDTVEVRWDGRCVAVLVRDFLRRWLLDPHPLGGMLTVDDLTWIITRAGAVSLTVPDGEVRPLAAHSLAELVELL